MLSNCRRSAVVYRKAYTEPCSRTLYSHWGFHIRASISLKPNIKVETATKKDLSNSKTQKSSKIAVVVQVSAARLNSQLKVFISIFVVLEYIGLIVDSSEVLCQWLQAGSLHRLGSRERAPLLLQSTQGSLLPPQRLTLWDAQSQPRERFRRQCHAKVHA